MCLAPIPALAPALALKLAFAFAFASHFSSLSIRRLQAPDQREPK